jgi:hypothetical protein
MHRRSSGPISWSSPATSADRLTVLADTMMPEAFERGGRYVGLATTAGFGLAFAISTNSPDARPLPFLKPADRTKSPSGPDS